MAARRFARAAALGLLAVGGTSLAEPGASTCREAAGGADEDAVCALQHGALKKDVPPHQPKASTAQVGVRRHVEAEATHAKKVGKQSGQVGAEGWPWHQDCAAAWGQCGGIAHAQDGSEEPWSGPTCCVDDYECVRTDEYYSQCKPMGEADEAVYDPDFDADEAVSDQGCVAKWGQCGGTVNVGGEQGAVPWHGPRCCVSGYTCVFESEYYSQCKPA